MEGFSNLKELINDVENFEFKRATLLESLHVKKTTKVPIEGSTQKRRLQNLVDWEVRSLEACCDDINLFVRDLKRSIKSTVGGGVLKISKTTI